MNPDPLNLLASITPSLGFVGKWLFAIVLIPLVFIYSLNKSVPEFLKFASEWRNSKKDQNTRIKESLSLLNDISNSKIGNKNKEILTEITMSQFTEKNKKIDLNNQEIYFELKSSFFVGIVATLETYIVLLIKLFSAGYIIKTNLYSITATKISGIITTQQTASITMAAALLLFYSSVNFIFISKKTKKFCIIVWSFIIVFYALFSSSFSEF